MLNSQPDINRSDPSIWGAPTRPLPINPLSGAVHPRASSTRPAPILLPSWSPGELVAAHKAYAAALRAITAAEPRVVALEDGIGNAGNSRFVPTALAGRAGESAIAERQMIAAAMALRQHGQLPFVATFADSWSRARDLIQTAASSSTDIHLVGSHGGVAGDQDGAAQRALEDIAMFRAITGSTVLVASDANQTAALVESTLNRPGVTYLRTLRAANPVIYRPGESFPIGGSHTLRFSGHDDVTLLGTGATVHEALAAVDILLRFGIRARVIDLYSVQPLDAQAVVEAARETGNIIVAEDHWAEGGLGDAVIEALADADSDVRVRRLGVHTRPTSGRPEDQLWRSGIDRTWIAAAARDLLEQPRPLTAHRRALRWARARHV